MNEKHNFNSYDLILILHNTVLLEREIYFNGLCYYLNTREDVHVKKHLFFFSALSFK